MDLGCRETFQLRPYDIGRADGYHVGGRPTPQHHTFLEELHQRPRNLNHPFGMFIYLHCSNPT